MQSMHVLGIKVLFREKCVCCMYMMVSDATNVMETKTFFSWAKYCTRYTCVALIGF